MNNKVIANISGTTSETFSIGKRGISVSSGSTEPLNSVGNYGDIYVLKGNKPKFYQKHTVWVEVGTKNINQVSQSTLFEAIFPEEVIMVDSSDVITIELTSNSLNTGYVIIIKDTAGNAAINNITITTQGSELIDGSASVTLTENHSSISLISDGSNYYII